MDDIERLAAWIDPIVIAEAISRELKANHYKFTFERGKKIWLDVLEIGLNDAIISAVYNLGESSDLEDE